jgi:hypothetical protein
MSMPSDRAMPAQRCARSSVRRVLCGSAGAFLSAGMGRAQSEADEMRLPRVRLAVSVPVSSCCRHQGEGPLAPLRPVLST